MPELWFVVQWICAGLQLLVALLAFLSRRAFDFPKTTPRQDGEYPRVSVIAPCRDEVDDIEASVQSLLAIDYPDYELVVVDDGSTDGTRDILAALSEKHEKLQVEYVDELPEGWLGKCHALHRGARRATGEWLLFSDGDTKHGPAVLKRSIERALEHDLDFLSLLPRNVGMTRFMRSFFSHLYSVTVVTLGMFVPTRKQQSLMAAGAGSFALIPRTVYEKCGGHESLRLAVVDDVGLAQLVRRHGGKTELHFSQETHVPYAPDLATLAKVTHKNGFAVIAYSWPAAIAFTIVSAVLGIATPLMCFGDFWPAALTFWIAIALTYRTVRRYTAVEPWGFILHPLVVFVTVFMVWRSALAITLNGGVRWRNRFHSLRDLKTWARDERRRQRELMDQS